MTATRRRGGTRDEALRRARITGVTTDADTAPVIGPADRPEQIRSRRLPRLARHTITLSDGHEVGVAVCGRGLPLVLVHGFTAEGMLYAQTLSRLVGSGFRVIAIDTAGHGGTLGLPTGGANLEHYTRLLGRVLDELGIRRAVLAGHSMGGRLVTELAAQEPDRAIAVVLLDAIVGDTWDRMVNLFRVAPPLLAGVGTALAIDTVTTLPLFRDPAQARKLGRLLAPVVAGHLRRPWRMMGPGVSIMRSRGSGWMLDRIAEEEIPLIVIHGERDVAVPMATARDAARRGHGALVTVQKAGHSWLLRDPRTLPAILEALIASSVGDAIAHRVAHDLGYDSPGFLHEASLDEVDAAYLEPDAPVLDLSPPFERPDTMPRQDRPRYRWSFDDVAPASLEVEDLPANVTRLRA
ncbi:alpha/beta hydrolase [Iamia sp. SCSIO 61187]|uniref:alpha/beta fold hydrolase n=1 Tax=Iamia sp. SCSIO 61187 TaxID=2722752 RepID=UPI001C637A24|nr:alpha/beta hydrolase [Iamia sp. SCSIO 61187]QYG93297.1 alpha/beta hydrolase [Iamia sp. SCSIO 61187]